MSLTLIKKQKKYSKKKVELGIYLKIKYKFYYFMKNWKKLKGISEIL